VGKSAGGGRGRTGGIGELSRKERMKKGDVILKRNGETQHIGQNKIRGKQCKEGEEQGEAGKEIDAKERPEREEKRDGIKGLKQGPKKEKLSVRFLFDIGWALE